MPNCQRGGGEGMMAGIVKCPLEKLGSKSSNSKEYHELETSFSFTRDVKIFVDSDDKAIRNQCSFTKMRE